MFWLILLGSDPPRFTLERQHVQPMQNRRRLAAAALALAAMTTVAACGSEPAEKRAEAATAEISDFEPGAKLTPDEAKKVVQTAAESMSTVHVEMEITAVEDGESTEGMGEGDFQQEPLGFHVKGKVSDLEGPTNVEFVTLEDVVYANMDGEWVMGGLANLMAVMMPPPHLFLESVTKAIATESTAYVGEESVEEIDTAHYTFSAGETDFGAEGSLVDVFVDSDGKLIRLRMNGGDSGTVDFGFSAHGEPVTIEKPAGEVVDMSDMDMG